MALTEGTGFQFRRSQAGSEVCGTVETFRVLATHTKTMAIGDPVKIIANTATTGDGLSTVDHVALTEVSYVTQVAGIIAGFDFDPDALSSISLGALKGGLARVIIDPNSVFEADVIGTALTRADTGQNADIEVKFVKVAGGLTTSQTGIDGATTPTNVVTRPLRIIEVLTGRDGVFGSRSLVSMNAGFTRPGTVGV